MDGESDELDVYATSNGDPELEVYETSDGEPDELNVYETSDDDLELFNSSNADGSPRDHENTVHTNIHALYVRGEPLLTRDAIEDLDRQLKTARPGGRVRLRGLDGNIVEVEIKDDKTLLSVDAGSM